MPNTAHTQAGSNKSKQTQHQLTNFKQHCKVPKIHNTIWAIQTDLSFPKRTACFLQKSGPFKGLNVNHVSTVVFAQACNLFYAEMLVDNTDSYNMSQAHFLKADFRS